MKKTEDNKLKLLMGACLITGIAASFMPSTRLDMFKDEDFVNEHTLKYLYDLQNSALLSYEDGMKGTKYLYMNIVSDMDNQMILHSVTNPNIRVLRFTNPDGSVILTSTGKEDLMNMELDLDVPAYEIEPLDIDKNLDSRPLISMNEIRMYEYDLNNQKKSKRIL